MASIITIPKELSKKGDLVLIPREEYEDLLRLHLHRKKEKITERDVLRWVKEARLLKKSGELSMLKSLSDLEK